MSNRWSSRREARCRSSPGRVGIAAAALVIASPLTLRGQDLRRELGSALQRIVVAQELPGATAAVSVDGRVIRVAAGQADRERGRTMPLDARMPVGSAGKTFFAALTVRLAREDRVDLDAPLATWLGGEPWFARLPNADSLTLRLLLAHRGGIANHAGDSAFTLLVRAPPAGGAPASARSSSIALALDRPAPFPAGRGFLYSDTGYLVAALGLERAIGDTYYRELERGIIRPLGLRATLARRPGPIFRVWLRATFDPLGSRPAAPGLRRLGSSEPGAGGGPAGLEPGLRMDR